MLYRYWTIQVLTGALVALALTELLWDKHVDIPESVPDSDTYSGPVDISGDIPEQYLRNIPVLVPDDTPVRADEFVRSGR